MHLAEAILKQEYKKRELKENEMKVTIQIEIAKIIKL